MRKHKKMLLSLALTLALAAVFACGICVGAGASGTAQKVTVDIDPSIAVTFDGIPQEFFDAQGKRVFPIAFNGTTYLPIRAVCQDLAGFKVGWDQATRTVSIASKDVDGVDLIDEYKAYDLTSYREQRGYQILSGDNKTAEISGYTLNHWLETYVTYWAGNGKGARVSLNIMGKYDTVTFKYYSTKDTTLQVIGDNDSVLLEQEVSGGQVAQEITVDLLKTSQLTFQFTNRTGEDTHGYIFDARLK